MPHIDARFRNESDVQCEIVRMLWTFHFATQQQLSRLVWDDAASNVVRKLKPMLKRLERMDMIWREPRKPLPGYASHTITRASGGLYFGLTETGKAWAAERMPELRVLHCITHEAYLSDPDRRTITHSVHCTEYCTRLIQYLRHHPRSVGMFFETESTLLGDHLRIDCLIRLRLRYGAAGVPAEREPRPPWYVPWMYDLRTPTVPGTLDATFALEIDESSESLPILHRKALNYRRTFAYGLPRTAEIEAMLVDARDIPTVEWQQVLCPVDASERIEDRLISFPTPVIVMRDERRLEHVGREWHDGWPHAEVRMTTWERLNTAVSVMSARYRNQEDIWVDLLGTPHN